MLLVFALPAFAQSAVSFERSSPPLTEVSGVVVEAGTGAPVARAVVSCVSAQQPVVFTGIDGRYQIKCSPHLNSVRVARPGFLEAVVPEMARDVIVDPVQWKEKLKQIRLVRAGVITGTIVNDLDEPVPHAAVLAQAPKIIEGFERLQTYGSGSSDDQGGFRIPDLPPGTYALHVQRSAGELITGTRIPPVVRRMLVQAGEGTGPSVRVDSGQEVPVDFKMVAVPAYSIAGVVKGIPKGSVALVTAERDDAIVSVNSVIGSGADVPFVLTSLPRGNYVIRLIAENNTLYSSAPANIAGTSLTGVELTVQPLPEIPLEVAGSQRVALHASQLCFVPVGAVTGAPWRQSYCPSSVDNQPGAFLLRSVPPGRYRLVGHSGIAGRILSARSGSVDILRDALTIGEGGAPAPIHIQLAQGNSQITVRCTGAPAEAALLFDADFPDRSPQFSSMAMDGRFLFGELPKGQYALVCLPKLDDFAYNEPGAYEKLKSWLTLVTLSGSESVKVDVKTFVKVTEP